MSEELVRAARQDEVQAVKRRLRMRVSIRTALIVALAITALVHLRALSVGYVYDDVEAILENKDLSTLKSAGRLFFVHYWGEFANIGLYRPFVQLSYLVDGAIFGFDPRISHAIQLLLHLGTVALAFGFLLRLGLHRTAAAVASTLLGIHPALLDASVWISGRTDVLCTLFVCTGLHLALSASDRDEGYLGSRTIAVGLAFLAALFAKELGIVLPILVLILPGERPWRRLPILMLAFAIYAAFRMNAIPGFLPEFASDQGVLFLDRDLWSRVALGARAVTRLLAFLMVPIGLAADHSAHPWAAPDAEVDAIAALALVLLTALGVGGLLLRRRDPVSGFLLAAVPISLLPVLQVVPIGAAMAERFLYLPALFVFAWASDRAWRLLPPALGFVLASVVILTAGATTFLRIPIYEDRGTFSRDTLKVYPEDHRAWNNLGVFHLIKLPTLEEGTPDPRAAEECFATALDLRPNYRRGRLNRARARLALEAEQGGGIGLLDPIEEWLDLAVAQGDPEALYLLGKVSLRTAKAESIESHRHEHAALARRRYERSAASFLKAGHPARAAAAWKEAGLSAELEADEAGWRAAFARSLELAPNQEGAAALRVRLER